MSILLQVNLPQHSLKASAILTPATDSSTLVLPVPPSDCTSTVEITITKCREHLQEKSLGQADEKEHTLVPAIELDRVATLCRRRFGNNWTNVVEGQAIWNLLVLAGGFRQASELVRRLKGARSTGVGEGPSTEGAPVG